MSDVTSGPSSTPPKRPSGGAAGDGAPSRRRGSRARATAVSRQAPRTGVMPIVIGLLVADLGAVAFFVLGLADLGIGLVAVSGFFGWLAALALVWRGREAAIADRRARQAVAAFLGAWVALAGMLIDWLYALLIGGVLGPLDYWGQRYGVTAVIALLAGALIAAYRAR